MNDDRILEEVARAVRFCFPQTGEQILREVERWRVASRLPKPVIRAVVEAIEHPAAPVPPWERG